MRWPIVVMLVTAPQLVLAQSTQPEPAVERVEIVEFGIYQTGKAGKVMANPNAARGQVTFVGRHKLIERTDTVCARLHATFGVEFKLVGAPAGRTVTLNMVTRFPQGGVTNDKGETFTQNKFNSGQIIGDKDFRSFTFDEPYELATGAWWLEFHYQGQVIGAQKFTVRNCNAGE
jgi:hypothetical protein